MIHAAHLAPLALALALVPGLAQAQSTERVSLDTARTQGNGNSATPSLSADARVVAFASDASNFTAGDVFGTFDIFARDRHTGVTECLSVDSTGMPANDESYDPMISADGRFVVFWSRATNLLVGDTNGRLDVFVHDRANGTVQIASRSSSGAQGNGDSLTPAISADGHFVAFWSTASNLVGGDTNGAFDVFVRDLQAGTTERVSVASGGAQANAESLNASISADGRFVSFLSFASNLVAGDTNGVGDIFVRDRLNGTTVRASLSSAGVQGDQTSGGFGGGSTGAPVNQLSADGRFVVFESEATNLVAGDTGGFTDVFVHDLLSGVTERASVDSAGVQGNEVSVTPTISADGRFVGFLSNASNLIAVDTNMHYDVFVHDRLLGSTERMSVDSQGAQANSNSGGVVLSGNGRLVGLSSIASNLVSADTNGSSDAFVRYRGGPPPAQAFCFGDGSSGNCPCANNGAVGNGCQNSSSTGGAQLTCEGTPSLLADSLALSSAGQVPAVTSIFLQGNSVSGAVFYGDGLRCVGGTLLRLYVRSAPPGSVASAPLGLEPSISARSAELGDWIGAGETRYYQTYYHDPVLSFCPGPQGSSWNTSSGLVVVWGQ